jgi:hypothetical protein
MIAFACMTPDEWESWREMAARVHKGTRLPCGDCPAAYAAQMRLEGRCCVTSPRAEAQSMRRTSERLRRQHVDASRRYRAKLRAQVEAVRAARRVDSSLVTAFPSDDSARSMAA